MLNASGTTGELSVLDNDTHRCTDNAEESLIQPLNMGK